MIDDYLSAFLAIAVVFVPLGMAALIMELRARQSRGLRPSGREDMAKLHSSISKHA